MENSYKRNRPEDKGKPFFYCKKYIFNQIKEQTIL